MSEDTGIEISLLDLAGLDTTGLEAKRIGDVIPRLVGDFECVEAELKEIKKEEKVTGFVAEFKFKVLGVKTQIDKDFAVEDMIGKEHREGKFLKDNDGIQYLIGFLEDIGVKQRGPLGDLVKAAIGKKITAQVTHRKDKNDSDKVYSSLTKMKILA